jgi:hypothetical protein
MFSKDSSNKIFSPPRHEFVRVHGFKGSGVQGCILVPGLDLGCVFTRKASASPDLIQNFGVKSAIIWEMSIFNEDYGPSLSLTLNVEP